MSEKDSAVFHSFIHSFIRRKLQESRKIREREECMRIILMLSSILPKLGSDSEVYREICN